MKYGKQSNEDKNIFSDTLVLNFYTLWKIMFTVRCCIEITAFNNNIKQLQEHILSFYMTQYT